MKVYSFQNLDCYDVQNIQVYKLSSLDKLVEDYHKSVNDNYGGNIEMFMEEYDNNLNYKNNNFKEAYNEMIKHPKYLELSENEKSDYNTIPIPISVEMIKSFDLSPGELKSLSSTNDYILMCHELVNTNKLNNNIVYTIQRETQTQMDDYTYSYNGNIYTSLDSAVEQFNKQLLNDFEKAREYYNIELNQNNKNKIDIPKYKNYVDLYKFFLENNFKDIKLYKPLSIDNINRNNIKKGILYKACWDEYGGYWVSLVSHNLIV
jgi:hypothetical protein